MAFENLKGIMGSLWQVGGPAGNALKAETYGLSVRDKTGSTLQRLGVGRAVSTTDATSFLDVQEKAILIQFSFDGASPPVAGTNTGNYGMCYTSGGSYNAGAIYLDTGSTLLAVSGYKGQLIMTTAAFTGSVSLVANGIYVAQTNTAPFSWTLKGDGAPTASGLSKSISLTVGLSNVSSTTSIPANSTVTGVVLNVTTGYGIGTTLAVTVNGSTPVTILSSTENDPTTVDLYTKQQDTLIGALNAGTVLVTVAGGPVAGASQVIVTYSEAFLA
jgi:hypothetical protein